MEQKSGRRVDFHIHTLFSDGCLLPSEITRRCYALGYAAIALTDHVDSSNLDDSLARLKRFVKAEGKYLPIPVLTGVEITHVPVKLIAALAKRAKAKGAQIIIIHGETVSEPVEPGTNRAALSLPGVVDILAHPGKIDEEEVKLAAANGIYLELTARRLHNSTNQQVAQLAGRFGAKLLVNTDSHGPEDFITQEQAREICRAAGLNESETLQTVRDNPAELLRKKGLTI